MTRGKDGADADTRGVTTLVLWTMRILLAANFLVAGGVKLGGGDMMIAMFAEIGLGQWFRYFVGGLEVVGALLLVSPRHGVIGARGLAVVMAGAVFVELLVLSGNPVVPLVLLGMLIAVERLCSGVRGAGRRLNWGL